MTARPEVEETVLQQVRAVAKERARHLTLDSNIDRLGLDSLERIEVIGRIGEIYSLEVPESMLSEIETCREISEAVLEQLEVRPAASAIPREYYEFEKMPEYVQLDSQIANLRAQGEENPFYRPHEGVSNNWTQIQGRRLINYSGYNYLGMSGDPAVTEAAKAALDRYGTSVSASRTVSGTRPLHNDLERDLAEFIGVEDSITFASGHSTNVTVIGNLMKRGDLIVHDELAHNSIVSGALLSGADRRVFPHNDFEALDRMLDASRRSYRRVLVVVEGVYSMDGDYPDLPRFIDVKNRHCVWLMIDEAHSIGTMGERGRGMGEFFGIEPREIEIWMGTLSKALGACGGYVGGNRPLIKYLRYTCSGVVYAVGLSPASAAAAQYVVRHLQDGSERVIRLQARSRYFLRLCRERGFNTGHSANTPIVPLILGSSIDALKSTRLMQQRGISVQPIVYPAVGEEQARLRFFISALHTEEQLRTTADTLAAVLEEVGVG